MVNKMADNVHRIRGWWRTMLEKRIAITLLSCTLLTGGCSFSADSLWPSLSSPSSKSVKQINKKITIRPSTEEKVNQSLANLSGGLKPPKLGATNFKVKAPKGGKPTGTLVGNKISTLRDDLKRLQASIDLSLIHIWRCRRLLTCRSRWSPYH